MALGPDIPNPEDIDKVLFIDRVTGQDISLQPYLGEDSPEGMYTMTSVGADNNVTRQFAAVDMDLNEGETGYTATIYERSRDFTVKHKAFIFTAVGTVTGIAAAVVVLRRPGSSS